MQNFKKIGFFSAFLIPTLVVWGAYLGGVGHFISWFFVFVLIPIIDLLIGEDISNVEASKLEKVANEYYYRFVTYCWAYFQLGFVIWGAYHVATTPLELYEWVGFLVGFSLVTGGIGITVAHELGHKKSAIERFYSKLLLMTTAYMHFYIEHNKGHHVYVSTLEDPATSRKGENFYAFWLRSVTQGWLSAWRIENNRLRKNGHSAFSLRNQMIWFNLLPLLFTAVLFVGISQIVGVYAWAVIPFFLIQAVLAFTLLEAVNYLEHYGLMRKEIAPGRFERVMPKHSWNNSNMISNFFLFQLQRHSDHHFNAIKRYQVLSHYDEAPQLPAGYPTMIMVAMFPPLWFAIMDKKLAAWEAKEQLTTA